MAEDPFGNNPVRPFLILSNDHVPFHGQECVAAVNDTPPEDARTPGR